MVRTASVVPSERALDAKAAPKKRKRKSSAKESDPQFLVPSAPAPRWPNLQRVRIFFDDPDATDSESDDDRRAASCGGAKQRKRCVVDVLLSQPRADAAARKPDAATDEAAGKPIPAAKKKRAHPRGVRFRYGKWSAAIRNPITHKRDWLGTFPTSEAASAAYEDRLRDYAEYRNPSARSRYAAVPAVTGESASSVTVSETYGSPVTSSVRNVEVRKPFPSKAPEPEPLSAIRKVSLPDIFTDLFSDLSEPDVNMPYEGLAESPLPEDSFRYIFRSNPSDPDINTSLYEGLAIPPLPEDGDLDSFLAGLPDYNLDDIFSSQLSGPGPVFTKTIPALRSAPDPGYQLATHMKLVEYYIAEEEEETY